MNSLKGNSERLFDELLNRFFNEKEVAEFKSLSELTSFEAISPSLKIKAKDKLVSRKFPELLLSIGKYALNEGEGDISFEIFERAIKESRGKPETAEYLAEAYLLLADIYKKKTKWTLSFRYLRKSKEIYKKIDNINGETKCSNMLGTIFEKLGTLRKQGYVLRRVCN